MDIEECVRLLLDRAHQFDQWNYHMIVGYIVRNKSRKEIRFYSSASNEQLHSLFIEAMSSAMAHGQQFEQLPPQQPPSSGLLPLVQWKNHYDPSGSLHGLQAPFHPIDQVRPQQQQQFHRGGNFHGIESPYLPIDQVRPQQQHQFHRSSMFQRIQSPYLPIDQVRLQQRQQFHPSSNFQGIQAPSPPRGPSPTGAFQSPFSEFIDLCQHPKSFRIPDYVMSSNHQNKSNNVTGYLPSSSKVQTECCQFYFSSGCKRGLDCQFSHVSGLNAKHNERQVGYLRSLHILEMDIRGLLLCQQLPVPIQHLPNMYLERYGKTLKIDGLHAESQWNGNNYYNLKDLLLKLEATRVVERQGQHYIIVAENVSKYLESSADSFKLVVPSKNSYRIYITMHPESTFTEEDVYKYFSKYGQVEDVRIPYQEKRMFGFERFSDPKTVRKILLERSPNTPHFISGGRVFAKLCSEKPVLEKFPQKVVHSKYSVGKVSDQNDIHAHHTGEKESIGHGFSRGNLSTVTSTEMRGIIIDPEMALQPTHSDNSEESLHLSNFLDQVAADQDRPDGENGFDTDKEIASLVRQMDFTKKDFKAYKLLVKRPNPLSHLLAPRAPQPQVVELPAGTLSSCQTTEEELEATIKSVQAKINQQTKGPTLEKLLRERMHVANVSKMLLSLEDEEHANQGGRPGGDVEDAA